MIAQKLNKLKLKKTKQTELIKKISTQILGDKTKKLKKRHALEIYYLNFV